MYNDSTLPLPMSSKQKPKTHASYMGPLFETSLTDMGNHLSDEHLELWPHAREQFQKLPIVLERFKAWKVVLDDLLHFFDAIHRIEASHAREFQKLGKTLTDNRGVEMREVFVSSPKTLGRLELSLQHMAQGHIATETFVRDTTIHQLNAIKSEVQSASKHYKQALEHLAHQIVKARQDTVTAISHHERTTKRLGLNDHAETAPKDPRFSTAAVSDRSSLALSSTGRAAGSDPWLAFRQLHAQLRRNVDVENEFQNRVLGVYRQVASMDARIVDHVRTTIEGYLGTLSQTHASFQEHTTGARGLLSALDPQVPFALYAQSFQLLETPAFTQPRLLEHFPYSTREIQVEKQGIVFRPGTVRRSKWRPAMMVLTETGWLHCFDAKLSKITKRARSVGGVGLEQPSLNPGPLARGASSEAVIEAQEQNVTNASTVPGLINESTGSVLRGPADFSTQPLPNPFKPFSICLAQPRVAVEVDHDRFHQHAFTISVQQSRRNKKRLNPFAATDGVTSYVLQARSEEEMIDWVASIKGKVECLMPEGPPAPIFRTPQEVEAEVERRRSNRESVIFKRQTAHARQSRVGSTGSVMELADAERGPEGSEGLGGSLPGMAASAVEGSVDGVLDGSRSLTEGSDAHNGMIAAHPSAAEAVESPVNGMLGARPSLTGGDAMVPHDRSSLYGHTQTKRSAAGFAADALHSAFGGSRSRQSSRQSLRQDHVEQQDESSLLDSAEAAFAKKHPILSAVAGIRPKRMPSPEGRSRSALALQPIARHPTGPRDAAEPLVTSRRQSAPGRNDPIAGYMDAMINAVSRQSPPSAPPNQAVQPPHLREHTRWPLLAAEAADEILDGTLDSGLHGGRELTSDRGLTPAVSGAPIAAPSNLTTPGGPATVVSSTAAPAVVPWPVSLASSNAQANVPTPSPAPVLEPSPVSKTLSEKPMSDPVLEPANAAGTEPSVTGASLPVEAIAAAERAVPMIATQPIPGPDQAASVAPGTDMLQGATPQILETTTGVPNLVEAAAASAAPTSPEGVALTTVVGAQAAQVPVLAPTATDATTATPNEPPSVIDSTNSAVANPQTIGGDGTREVPVVAAIDGSTNVDNTGTTADPVAAGQAAVPNSTGGSLTSEPTPATAADLTAPDPSVVGRLPSAEEMDAFVPVTGHPQEESFSDPFVDPAPELQQQGKASFLPFPKAFEVDDMDTPRAEITLDLSPRPTQVPQAVE